MLKGASLSNEETELLNAASLDKRIEELRQQGYGIKGIAKTLGCTTWRVRKIDEELAALAEKQLCSKLDIKQSTKDIGNTPLFYILYLCY